MASTESADLSGQRLIQTDYWWLSNWKGECSRVGSDGGTGGPGGEEASAFAAKSIKTSIKAASRVAYDSL